MYDLQVFNIIHRYLITLLFTVNPYTGHLYVLAGDALLKILYLILDQRINKFIDRCLRLLVV